MWTPKSAISPEQTCLKQENVVIAPSAKTLKHNSLPLNSGQTSITPQLPLIAPNPLSKNGKDTVLSPRPVGTVSTPSMIKPRDLRRTTRVEWKMLTRPPFPSPPRRCHAPGIDQGPGGTGPYPITVGTVSTPSLIKPRDLRTTTWGRMANAEASAVSLPASTSPRVGD